ncbi:MAG TPA: MBL fold metallo-hydrolase [Byssovorax sp.]
MAIGNWGYAGALAAAAAVALAVMARGARPPEGSAAGAKAEHVTVADRSPPRAGHVARDLKITILSTMLAESGIGEWGFGALVDVDGHRILFDTGRFPDTVKKNAASLGVDLTTVPDVVLSHHHGDHTGGFLALRDDVRDEEPKALARAHVGKGFFWPRRAKRGGGNPMIAARPKFEATGGQWVEHDAPVELFPGVWLTGPVPRAHDEKNYGRGVEVDKPSGWAEDDVPEDQSLIIDTRRGLVVLSGCGHAGVVNTLEYAQKVVRDAHVHAVIGGFHLYQLDDERLAWTATELRAMGVEDFLGAHCTGLEATYRMRDLLGLARDHCEVGAVGASFSSDTGIDPLTLAK